MGYWDHSSLVSAKSGPRASGSFLTCPMRISQLCHTHTNAETDRQTDTTRNPVGKAGLPTLHRGETEAQRGTTVFQTPELPAAPSQGDSEQDSPHLATEPLSLRGLEMSSQAVRRAAARHTE